MRVLFIHRHAPGQFEHLIRALAANPDHAVVVIGQEFSPREGGGPEPRVLRYRQTDLPRQVLREFLLDTERQIENGLSVARLLGELRAEGFVPDIALAHLGWGEALFFKDIYPGVPLIGFCEYYYQAHGADADFDPTFPLSMNDRFRIRAANAVPLLSLAAVDLGVSPTRWQKSRFPAEFQRKISVVHEGVDTDRIQPDAAVCWRLPDGRELDRRSRVVTYATRNLEPYRGFPVFMRSVAELCRRRQDVEVVIAGGDQVAYSARPRAGSYREQILAELDFDPVRVHFVGRLPFPDYVRLLQVSSVHVYLTVPFVLSWSLLEAMSAGCAIVASNTAPVREVLVEGENALLVDFFAHRDLADRVEALLDAPERARALGAAARATVLRQYSATAGVAGYSRLIDDLIAGHRFARLLTP